MSDKENIAEFFISSVQPGQVREAVNELRILTLEDQSIPRPVFHEIARQVVEGNKQIMMIPDGGQPRKVIIASELCVAPCTYVSPENSFLFVIDHVSQKSEVLTEPAPILSPSLKYLRTAILKSMKKSFIPELNSDNDYLASAISPANQIISVDTAVSVNLNDTSKSSTKMLSALNLKEGENAEGTLQIICSVFMRNPSSLWEISWTSHYSLENLVFVGVKKDGMSRVLPDIANGVEIEGVRINGHVRVTSHCYEDSNVQMNCEKNCTFTLDKPVTRYNSQDNGCAWVNELVGAIELRESALEKSLTLGLKACSSCKTLGNPDNKSGLKGIRRNLQRNGMPFSVANETLSLVLNSQLLSYGKEQNEEN